MALRRSVRQWLRAENRGDDAAAERSLQRIFGVLPLAPVPVGFTERVLVASGRRRAAAPGWLAQWAFGLGAFVVLAALAQLSVVFREAVDAGLTTLVVSGGQLLVETMAVIGVLAGIGRTLASALSSPAVLAICVSAMLLSTAAFALLRRLLTGDRSRRDAELV